MTTRTLTPVRSLGVLRTGVALAALIAIVDLAGMIALGLPAAPLAVNIITTVLGVATLLGAIWAWRGASWAIWLVAISRGLAALAVVPILFVPEAPQEAIPMSVVVLVLTVVAIVLLLRGRAKRV